LHHRVHRLGEARSGHRLPIRIHIHDLLPTRRAVQHLLVGVSHLIPLLIDVDHLLRLVGVSHLIPLLIDVDHLLRLVGVGHLIPLLIDVDHLLSGLSIGRLLWGGGIHDLLRLLRLRIHHLLWLLIHDLLSRLQVGDGRLVLS